MKHNQSTKVISYKGFDKAFTGRGYQYAIGQTYTHNGAVEVCESGFHACEYPLDVLRYYSPVNSRFAVVEQSGELARHDDDSKIASSHISIIAERSLGELIKAAVEYTFSRAAPVNPGSPASTTDFRGAASATGECGVVSATGYRGAASATGKHAVACGLGDVSAVMAAETGAVVLIYRGVGGEIVHIRASKVGENGIKPGVWYALSADGEFMEVPKPWPGTRSTDLLLEQ